MAVSVGVRPCGPSDEATGYSLKSPLQPALSNCWDRKLVHVFFVWKCRRPGFCYTGLPWVPSSFPLLLIGCETPGASPTKFSPLSFTRSSTSSCMTSSPAPTLPRPGKWRGTLIKEIKLNLTTKWTKPNSRLIPCVHSAPQRRPRKEAKRREVPNPPVALRSQNILPTALRVQPWPRVHRNGRGGRSSEPPIKCYFYFSTSRGQHRDAVD